MLLLPHVVQMDCEWVGVVICEEGLGQEGVVSGGLFSFRFFDFLLIYLVYTID